MDELIDKLVAMALNKNYEFNKEEIDKFLILLLEKGVLKRNEKNKTEIIPEVYDKINGRKNLLFVSSKEKNIIARFIISSNPCFFFSREEMKELLDDEKIFKTIDDFGIEVVVDFIKETGEIERYLTGEKIRELGLNSWYIVDLIKATRHIEDYLKLEKIEELGLNIWEIVDLIKATGHTEDYLKLEKIEELGLESYTVPELIKATGKIGKYLTGEKIREFGLDIWNIVDLIKATGEIGKYLTGEKIREFGLDIWNIVNLIKETGEIEKYLTGEKIREFGLDIWNIVDLIKATGHIEEYMKPEKIEELGLNGYELIKATGHIEKYLIPEKLKELGLNKEDLIRLLEIVQNSIEYVTDEMIETMELRGNDISSILLGREEIKLAQLIDEELDKGTYNRKKYEGLSNIINDLQASNSGRIAKIAIELALQIYELDEKQQEAVIKSIKSIYCTTDLPTFAQNFLVFKQLHPNFLGGNNEKIYKDASIGNIPSLDRASISERNHLIFSDLLRIAVESNNRNLRDYLYIIEQGDKLFNLYKEGKLKIDDTLAQDNRETLKKYSSILNALYNQTSKGKRLKTPRENSGDLEKDLQELDNLLLGNTKIKRSLPDRIARMFGYWAGIRDFEQAKKLIEMKAKEADRRNRSLAKKGEFIVQEGDFAKGITETEYFASMLQNGIVAKDYLGQDSTSDETPLDMDIELIKEEGNIQTAKRYTNGDINGRKLGKIIIVIKNDGSYVRTSNGIEIDQDGVRIDIWTHFMRECIIDYVH